MKRQSCRAQAAFEYLLLLGLVTAITLVAMNRFLPRVNRDADVVFNAAALGILGADSKIKSRTTKNNYP